MGAIIVIACVRDKLGDLSYCLCVIFCAFVGEVGVVVGRYSIYSWFVVVTWCGVAQIGAIMCGQFVVFCSWFRFVGAICTFYGGVRVTCGGERFVQFTVFCGVYCVRDNTRKCCQV